MEENNTVTGEHKYSIGNCFVNHFGHLLKIYDIVDEDCPYKVERCQGENIDTIYVGEKYLDDIRKI